MNWTIPGTTITAPREDAQRIDEQFRSMFLAGGIVLSQVTNITGLDPYMVQNWVKRGFLSTPKQKRYSLNQLCRIININMLKGVLPMERICGLLSYINGSLTDESDDIIDDTALYFMFVDLAARARDLEGDEWDAAMAQTMSGYQEPFPGAKDRICTVLRIMLTAWISTRMRQAAEAMLATLA